MKQSLLVAALLSLFLAACEKTTPVEASAPEAASEEVTVIPEVVSEEVIVTPEVVSETAATESAERAVEEKSAEHAVEENKEVSAQ